MTKRDLRMVTRMKNISSNNRPFSALQAKMIKNPTKKSKRFEFGQKDMLNLYLNQENAKEAQLSYGVSVSNLVV